MKPFFFRVDAAKFLAAVVVVPEDKRSEWVLALALDMVEANSDNCKSEFAKEIIEEASRFSEKKRNAGKLGGLAKASTAKVCSSTAVAKPSTPLASNSNSTKENNKRKTFNPLVFLESNGVDISVARDWLQVRKDKKLSSTETSLTRIGKQVELSGKSWNEVIGICCEKSWGGFNSNWVIDIPTKKKESYMDMNGVMQER